MSQTSPPRGGTGEPLAAVGRWGRSTPSRPVPATSVSDPGGGATARSRPAGRHPRISRRASPPRRLPPRRSAAGAPGTAAAWARSRLTRSSAAARSRSASLSSRAAQLGSCGASTCSRRAWAHLCASARTPSIARAPHAARSEPETTPRPRRACRCGAPGGRVAGCRGLRARRSCRSAAADEARAHSLTTYADRQTSARRPNRWSRVRPSGNVGVRRRAVTVAA
jgi:hypothetical protein